MSAPKQGDPNIDGKMRPLIRYPWRCFDVGVAVASSQKQSLTMSLQECPAADSDDYVHGALMGAPPVSCSSSEHAKAVQSKVAAQTAKPCGSKLGFTVCGP